MILIKQSWVSRYLPYRIKVKLQHILHTQGKKGTHCIAVTSLEDLREDVRKSVSIDERQKDNEELTGGGSDHAPESAR